MINNIWYKVIESPTGIIGYYLKDGLIYRDNIRIIPYDINKMEQAFTDGEKCLFYRDTTGKGILLYPDGKRDILPYRKVIYISRITKYIIDKLLSIYGGFTIYESPTGKQRIEIYHA